MTAVERQSRPLSGQGAFQRGPRPPQGPAAPPRANGPQEQQVHLYALQLRVPRGARGNGPALLFLLLVLTPPALCCFLGLVLLWEGGEAQ